MEPMNVTGLEEQVEVLPAAFSVELTMTEKNWRKTVKFLSLVCPQSFSEVAASRTRNTNRKEGGKEEADEKRSSRFGTRITMKHLSSGICSNDGLVGNSLMPRPRSLLSRCSNRHRDRSRFVLQRKLRMLTLSGRAERNQLFREGKTFE